MGEWSGEDDRKGTQGGLAIIRHDQRRHISRRASKRLDTSSRNGSVADSTEGVNNDLIPKYKDIHVCILQLSNRPIGRVKKLIPWKSN